MRYKRSLILLTLLLCPPWAAADSSFDTHFTGRTLRWDYFHTGPAEEEHISLDRLRLAVDEPDSPHHGFAKTKAELYIAAAETDSYAPPEMIERVEEVLAGCDVTSRVEWYPGTHHGFAFPGRGEVYDKAAAERHWSRLHSLFDRNLKG